MELRELRDVQRRVWANKQRQGFNTTDVALELCLLHGELGEFFQAWRRGRPDAGEELADVAIYLLGLAEMVGVDLDAEITYKIARNAARRYELREGVPVKVQPGRAERDGGWRVCARARTLPAHADTAPDPAGGPGCGMAWRVRDGEVEHRHVTDLPDPTDHHNERHSRG